MFSPRPSSPLGREAIAILRYFSISDDQFKMTDKGAELDVSTFVLTRNFCPSGVTS